MSVRVQVPPVVPYQNGVTEKPSGMGGQKIYRLLAQMEEHRTFNPQVPGSSPGQPTII